jgi:hypothetical protein
MYLIRRSKATLLGLLLGVTTTLTMTAQPAFSQERRELDIDQACATLYAEGRVASVRYYLGGWHTPIMRNGRVIQHVCSYRFLAKSTTRYRVSAAARGGAQGSVGGGVSRAISGELIVSVGGEVGGEYGSEWESAYEVEAKKEPVWNSACQALYGRNWTARLEDNRTRIFCVGR